MKKSSKKILPFLVMFCFLMAIIVIPVKINADSGFDFDYGSSGGSSGFSSSGSSGGSASDSFPTTKAEWITCLIFISICIVLYKNKIKRLKASLDLPTTWIGEEDVKKYLPDFDVSDFLESVYPIFVDIQKAWMNFDLKSVREYISDDLYNMYSTQLDTLKIKGQQNIMEDFQKEHVEILEMRKDNDEISIVVRLVVKFKDYIVDSNRNVIRGDLNTYKVFYNLTFVLSEKNIQKKVICPNCHATVKMNQFGKCEYCDSVLVRQKFNFILTKKQFIGKERG